MVELADAQHRGDVQEVADVRELIAILDTNLELFGSIRAPNGEGSENKMIHTLRNRQAQRRARRRAREALSRMPAPAPRVKVDPIAIADALYHAVWDYLEGEPTSSARSALVLAVTAYDQAMSNIDEK